MTRNIAMPFLTLSDEVVGFKGWKIGDPDQPLRPASDMLEAWDYARDLEIMADLELDFQAAAQALALPPEELKLAIVIKAGTGAGTLPRRVDRLATRVIGSDASEISIPARIRSANLSGRLRLEATILLEAPTMQGNALSPRFKGARLWSTKKDILLEGGGDSRFPIELLSFSQAFRGQPHEDAPWYLHWRPGQLDADFGGSVRLYVNSDDEAIAQRFVEGDSPTLQAMLGDVLSQMVAASVSMPECEEILENAEEGTVGQQVRNWMDIAFPNQSTAVIRGALDMTPGRFHAALLAAADIRGAE